MSHASSNSHSGDEPFSLATSDLFEEPPDVFGLSADVPPWEILGRLSDVLGASAATPARKWPSGLHVRGLGPVWIDPTSEIWPGSAILAPTYIGPGVRLLPGAFVRQSWIGPRSLVGHAVEVARSVLIADCAIPHQSIVLDSALGRGVNVAGGARFANLPLAWVGGRAFGRSINVVNPSSGHRIDTGLPKLGFLCGDGVLMPFALATNPGTVVGRGCVIRPRDGIALGGTWPPGVTIDAPPGGSGS